MKLTDEELAAMPAKTKKIPDVVKLYQDHDFLEAYAKHTDQRIAQNGYKAAVGSGDNWEMHGDLQRDFLISRGLRPGHRLMEIGCGTGRLARKVVPYLGDGGYVGIDISAGARENCRGLALSEGWAHKRPIFLAEIPSPDVPVGDAFDFIWSFSVMIHVPQDVMESLMRRAAAVMHAGSKFLFSYVPESVAFRSGVKQFRKTLDQHKQAAAQAGLSFEDVGDWIRQAGHEPSRATGHQRVALASKV